MQGHNILFKFNSRLNFNFFILNIERAAKVKLHFHKIYNSRCNLIEWYGEDMNYFYATIFFHKFLYSLLFLKKSLIDKKKVILKS